ncbi:aspartate aminotransferase family protein [Rhodospirillaceae bacterium KN72]|uniref:Acetylornithine aminotransferase n=1 Tax=Pacificispira spongiicola TaxID=2729598 RepID=A0A7Y0E192_9PROT|nr:aspartate aminotransferase family protein [Pacificispira spongiicola]NMM45370.1 aspartate aminotransferase family protein [Pacificispira spongiicola]
MSEVQQSAVMNTYARSPIAFDRGEGVYLWDTDGRRYLDFYAGIAVNSLGHAHPHLVAALKAQAEKLWHVANLYTIPEGEKLAKRLTENSFADRVFFTNSGVEALEGLIKLARRYHAAGGNPERYRVVTVEGAFHGRSLATIAAANNKKYLDGFGPKVDGFDNVPFGNMNALRDAIGPETAAILLEPIQGEGGIRAADLDYLRQLRAAADEFGILLILDEVQSGNGRTGKMWAHEWAGIEPDAIATAKGIGGGFPMGAILAKEEAARGLTPGTHGTTFGGNPLAMAVGNAVLDVIGEPGFMERVEKVGDYLWDKMAGLVAKHPTVFAGQRGAGLMQGLACQPDVSNLEFLNALREAGLLTVGAGENVIRLLPPLIVEEKHVDEAAAIIDTVAGQWSKKDA